ncbi:hypothetical protein GCM10027277_51530 [Pseudoduganella ginsengisoli]|uniref:Uncharacterized protein n=1 Tax=Pseudoduganella ginsengisoli TaxID=1462440 RepID=A0A6L6Q4M0_9BURK|nr:hypothetical protein [Pseudoduganella ginsengisoli]MTW04374.1 hypothetical protein [Pseudoduganella ginsengisoli]
MNQLFRLALAMLLVALSFAYAGETRDWWQYRPFKGSYLVYSGSLGEEQPPTQKDRKVSFNVSGPIAKEMFDSMYPDVKEAEKCSSDKGYRERNKGEVSCIHDSDGYRCFFGFDLRTGKSITGATC